MLSIFLLLPAAMDRASLVVDGSNSVDKKMPPGFLVVDGSAAALFPPPPPPPPLGLGPLMEKTLAEK